MLDENYGIDNISSTIGIHNSVSKNTETRIDVDLKNKSLKITFEYNKKKKNKLDYTTLIEEAIENYREGVSNEDK